jgi:nucleoside-diphosphate-sugar epimerase
MPETVLVTGAFGLVGSTTVKLLSDAGRHVVATDLGVPANRKAAGQLSGVDVRWADLTDPAAVETLLAEVSPTAIIHLAAVIPPLCYANPQLARRVNVDATASLIRAAEALPSPPRFVQASSIAAYGARNPHRHSDLLSADTPLRPSDLYGAHKAEVEGLVRASRLDWVILRLGGVLNGEPRFDLSLDLLYFEGVLPIDGRIQTVDVRDVAAAFIAATTADAVSETLLIGGDDSHRLVQGDVGPAMSAAMGLVGGLPAGRKGDPASDDAWFATDWMDTGRAQEVLNYQQHSWPDMLIEAAEKTGWKRPVLRVIAPLAYELLKRRAPYYRAPGIYADPWGAVRAKWGDPGPDRSTS